MTLIDGLYERLRKLESEVRSLKAERALLRVLVLIMAVVALVVS